MPTAALTPPRKRRSLPLRASWIPLGALILTGCGGGDLVLPSETGPASLRAIAGTGQSGTVGRPLADSVEVRVTDRQGQPVQGVRVAFVPAASAGSASPDTVVTNADGRARARWVLGTTAGPQALSVRIPGQENNSSLTTTFTATAAPGAATSIALSSGDNQSAPAGAQLANPLVVIVTDGHGNPVDGVDVSWAAEGAGGVNPATTTTGPDGLASTRRTLGPGAGTQSTSASSTGLENSPVRFTHTATTGRAAALQLVSGNNQTGVPGAELADPLVVRLVDAGGNPIAGSPVSWVLGTGGGSVAPSGDTDAGGMASARFTLGPATGVTNTVSAVVSGVGVVAFTASSGGGGGGGGSSDANSTITASPTSIQALAGSSTITVTVRDGSGAPVSGAAVGLSASGSGNTLTQPSGTTGADGVAIGSLSSIVPGTKVVSATVNGTVLIVQTANVVVTLAQATTLQIVAGNGQTADQGSAVPVRPSVRVNNDAGQGVAGFGVTFVVTGGNGSVTGAAQTTNSAGEATVGSWVLGDPGTNTLEARATGLNGSPAVFTATANQAGGDRLTFRVQPATPQVEDQDFTPTVEVAIVDAANSVVPLSGVLIQLSVSPRQGRLTGPDIRNTNNGIAVFDGLGNKRNGSGFALTASSPSRSDLGEATSNPFDVTKR